MTCLVEFQKKGTTVNKEEYPDAKAARRSLRSRGLSVRDAERTEGGYLFQVGENNEVVAFSGKSRIRAKGSPKREIVLGPKTVAGKLNLSQVTPEELVEKGEWSWEKKKVKEINIGDIIFFSYIRDGEGVYFQIANYTETISNEKACFRISVEESPLTYALIKEDQYLFLTPTPSSTT